jgi:aminopeptidase S
VKVARGATGKTIISTAVTGGSAQPITLTATGVPAKVKATFVTNPVTAGATSKLKFAVGTGATKGTYSITVTGAETGGATHATTVSLKVT